MPDITDEDGLLRSYLLGSISSDAERQKIEERLMLDDDYFQELLIQEEELIQDFADGYLENGELEDFRTHFFISEERREKIKFARILRLYLDKQKKIKKEEDECGGKNSTPPSPKMRLFVGILFYIEFSNNPMQIVGMHA